jgi:hypothetical protein
MELQSESGWHLVLHGSWSADAFLGHAARGLGQPGLVRQLFSDALRIGTELGAFFPFLMALPGIAHLLAAQGQVTRAVELYVLLASLHPGVADLRWFEDVAGRHVAAAAASLPPEAVEAAQARGCALAVP